MKFSNLQSKNWRMWASTDWGTVFPDEEDRLEAYNDMAEANGFETKTEEDDEVMNFIQDLVCDYWNEKFEGATNLRHVVVTGYFGAWDGRHEIIPCKCKDIEEAIDKCCSIRGDWDADVYFEKDDNGWDHLIVGVSHHDGNCRYEISLLVNYGEMEEDDDPKKYKLKAISHEMVFGA